MTCVAALIDNGTIYMGGDSACVAGADLTIMTDPKVFRRDDMLFGYTSSFRMGQLIKYCFGIPRLLPEETIDEIDIYKYMVTDFINALRNCLKEGGYVEINNNVEHGGCFMVGYKSRLFYIDSDFQVAENILPYYAIGCGGPYALGSLYSTAGIDIDPENRILIALNAAQQFNVGVRGPFLVLKS